MTVHVVEQRGSVADLHALDPFARGPLDAPVVWWCRPTDDAIVLGSRQPDEVVDRAACRRVGLDVVRRRSGGGAVILRRDAITWIDLVLPHGVVPDDVRGSMEWAGERWLSALGDHAPPGAVVHRAGMVDTPWSEWVCFSGIGPGEVTVGDDKLVGLSQRRTRHGIRVQGLVCGSSVAHEYRDLLRGELPAGDPPGQAWLAALDPGGLATALAQRITPV